MEELYNIVEQEKIKLITENLGQANGFYLCCNNKHCILLNRDLQGINEKMTLAEELGHHFKGVLPNCPFNTDYQNKIIRSKNEFKAFSWSQSKLVPFGIENKLIDTDNTIYEVSEEISIPVDFLYKTLEYRKENNL